MWLQHWVWFTYAVLGVKIMELALKIMHQEDMRCWYYCVDNVIQCSWNYSWSLFCVKRIQKRRQGESLNPTDKKVKSIWFEFTRRKLSEVKPKDDYLSIPGIHQRQWNHWKQERCFVFLNLFNRFWPDMFLFILRKWATFYWKNRYDCKLCLLN